MTAVLSYSVGCKLVNCWGFSFIFLNVFRSVAEMVADFLKKQIVSNSQEFDQESQGTQADGGNKCDTYMLKIECYREYNLQALSHHCTKSVPFKYDRLSSFIENFYL